MSSGSRFLFLNGVLLHPSGETPPVTTLLQSHPGAYTTTRTHNNGSSLLFWKRHLSRLADSARILLNSKPNLLFQPGISPVQFLPFSAQLSPWNTIIGSLVNDSIAKVMPIALKERKSGQELAITALLSGNSEKLCENKGVNELGLLRVFDVYVHVGMYVPPVFGVSENLARLAVVGPGREIANAKYSDWVRLRKPLEKLRPDSVTELLLSNDGDRILEGCLTNFFVVCRKNEVGSNAEEKELRDPGSTCFFEVQTAPVSDGVLPGIIRQVIIEVCFRNGIKVREVAPSWSECEIWEEAFITNSLRLLQHVETIRVPNTLELLESNSLKDVTWEEKRFKEGPGRITTLIQEEVMEKANCELFPFALSYS